MGYTFLSNEQDLTLVYRLCPRSAFFLGASRGGFIVRSISGTSLLEQVTYQTQEAATGCVRLEESEEVVEALLQYIYGVDVAFFDCLPVPVPQSSEDLPETLAKLVRLYIAAEKVRHCSTASHIATYNNHFQYGIAGLKIFTAEVINVQLQHHKDPDEMAQLAHLIFENTIDTDIRLRQNIAEHIWGHLDNVLADSKAKDSVLKNLELMETLLRLKHSTKPGVEPSNPRKRLRKS